MIHFVSKKQIDNAIKECQALEKLAVLCVIQEKGKFFTVLCDYIAISAPLGLRHKASPGLMLPGSHYNTSLDAKLVTKTNSCTVKV